jgi:DNA-binding GntR family transcriptional regulator
LREPNIEDELLDPYNPKSIWAYMWFSDEELKPKRRRKKRNTNQAFHKQLLNSRGLRFLKPIQAAWQWLSSGQLRQSSTVTSGRSFPQTSLTHLFITSLIRKG